MRFAPERSGPWAFCACAEPAVANLLELNRREPPRWGKTYEGVSPWRGADFSDAVLELAAAQAGGGVELAEFRPDLCHRCIGAVPSLRYCHEMYGGRLVQAYGWYINQQFLHAGIRPAPVFDFLPEVCPEPVQEMARAWQAADRERERLLGSEGDGGGGVHPADSLVVELVSEHPELLGSDKDALSGARALRDAERTRAGAERRLKQYFAKRARADLPLGSPLR
jgi:hypothetical protein